MSNWLNKYVPIKDLYFYWFVEETVIHNWCVQSKIRAIYMDGVWLVDVTQERPLLTFEEFTVFCLEDAVSEFDYDYVFEIYYSPSNNCVYTDLMFEEDEFRSTPGDFIIYHKTSDSDYITAEELKWMCYGFYLNDYYNNTHALPIFLKRPEFEVSHSLITWRK